MSNRDLLQKEAYQNWTGNSTIVLPTGVGKTKIGVMSAKDEEKVLIVVPKVNLKDQWKREFVKWGVTTEPTVVTRNSAKNVAEEFDLCILDEIHGLCTTVYSKLFSTLKCKKKLGLTATVPEEQKKLEILNKYCPISHTLELGDLPEGVVADYSVYNIGLQLSKADAGKYKAFNQLFIRAQKKLLAYKREHKLADSFFTLAEKNLKTEGELGKMSRDFWSAMTLRRNCLMGGESKIKAAVNLIKEYPKQKWIIFNSSITVAESLQKALTEANFASKLVHSKMSQEENNKVLEEFRDNKFNIINSVKSLIEGTDIPNIEFALCLAHDSKKLPMVQSLGRVIRKSGNKTATFFNLYYVGTQDEKWVRSKTGNLKTIWQTNILKNTSM